MKKIIFIFYMIILIVSMGHSQGKDVDSILCSAEWRDITIFLAANQKNSYTWIKCPQEKQVPDIGYTSYIFEKSGKHIWNTHPKCGNNLESVRGEGTWTLTDNRILEVTYPIEHEYDYGKNRSVIKKKQYKLIDVSEEKLQLKEIDL